MFRRAFKKGFSLMEVVVSVLIITIVTATAITFITSAHKRDQSNLHGIEISVICQNAIDCYDYSSSAEEFLTLIQKTDADFTGFFDGETLQGAILQKKTFKVTVLCAYGTGASLSITATDSDGKVIYTLAKGGAK